MSLQLTRKVLRSFLATGNVLQQLLANLLQNALTYTDPDGKLQIALQQFGSSVRLLFRDSPPGVSPSELERLFERLYRVESSRNRGTGGAGLGLAICRNIVEAHGGSIGAYPSKLGGVGIRVELPKAGGVSVAESILIVEDEEKLARLLADYLRQAGFSPICLGDGAAVLPWLREHAPDLILLDLMLPGKGGAGDLQGDSGGFFASDHHDHRPGGRDRPPARPGVGSRRLHLQALQPARGWWPGSRRCCAGQLAGQCCRRRGCPWTSRATWPHCMGMTWS